MIECHNGTMSLGVGGHRDKNDYAMCTKIQI